MKIHKVISDDTLERIESARRRLGEAWARMTDLERQAAGRRHEADMDLLALYEEQERKRQREGAAWRAFAEAYNSAPPEEHARPFHEWYDDYRRKQAGQVTEDGIEHD